MNQKPQIGKLYTLSRKSEQPVYAFPDRECGDYSLAKKIGPDNIIMLLSDKIEQPWGGHAYKTLTETGDVGYIYENNSVKLVFTAIS